MRKIRKEKKGVKELKKKRKEGRPFVSKGIVKRKRRMRRS